jgi:hypothetical protein
MTAVAAAHLLPVKIELGTIKDVSVAVSLLQGMEQFHEHVSEHLGPSTSSLSEQWQNILYQLEDRLSERRDVSKGFIYESYNLTGKDANVFAP